MMVLAPKHIFNLCVNKKNSFVYYHDVTNYKVLCKHILCKTGIWAFMKIRQFSPNISHSYF